MKLQMILGLSLAGSFSIHASTIALGSTGTFAVLGGSTVTNTGSSNITGSVGASAGSAITGFPPGTVIAGSIHSGDAVAAQAQSDLTTAYNMATASPCTTTLSGQNLGGLTLLPGVYCFASSAQLTGVLTLNATGDPNAFFLFKIGSALTTASFSSVAFTNGGQGGSVFWQVGSSASLGTNSAFAGNILALTSITANTGANIQCGRALARNGTVTLDNNIVSACNDAGSASPEPSTVSLSLLLGAIGFLYLRKST